MKNLFLCCSFVVWVSCSKTADDNVEIDSTISTDVPAVYKKIYGASQITVEAYVEKYFWVLCLFIPVFGFVTGPK